MKKNQKISSKIFAHSMKFIILITWQRLLSIPVCSRITLAPVRPQCHYLQSNNLNCNYKKNPHHNGGEIKTELKAKLYGDILVTLEVYRAAFK